MTFFKTLLASTLGFFLSFLIVFVLAFVMIFAFAASVSSSSVEMVSVAEHSVLEVELSGAIPEYIGEESFAAIFKEHATATLREYLDAIDAAIDDPNIDGIWLQPNGFGGGLPQAQELRRKLAEFKASGKFIYASSGVNGFSEIDYYLASVADSIILHPGGGVEMNGVYAGLAYFKPVMKKLGIEPIVVRAGSYKSAVEPFTLDSASIESETMIQELIDSSFADIKATVMKARDLSQQGLQDILDNKPVLLAEAALQARLVDVLMYEDELEAFLKQRTGKEDDKSLAEVDIDDYVKNISEGGDDNTDEDKEKTDDQIAIVYAAGGIGSGESGNNPNPIFGGNKLGSETFIEAMQAARKSERVKAIVLRIDSPGGEVPASKAMWREVVLANKEKPVIVSMAGVAASGGYYIAAPATTIVAEPTTITGSIGVFSLGFDMSKLWHQTIGINTQIIKSDPHADMYSGFRPLSDLERTVAEQTVNDIYQEFLRIVAEGRGMTVEQVDSVAQGRVWTGARAQQLGLVDTLGGIQTAINIAASRAGVVGGYTLRILPKEKEWFETLADMFSNASAMMFGRDTELEQYEQMVEALKWRGGMQARMIDIKIQ